MARPFTVWSNEEKTVGVRVVGVGVGDKKAHVARSKKFVFVLPEAADFLLTLGPLSPRPLEPFT